MIAGTCKSMDHGLFDLRTCSYVDFYVYMNGLITFFDMFLASYVATT